MFCFQTFDDASSETLEESLIFLGEIFLERFASVLDGGGFRDVFDVDVVHAQKTEHVVLDDESAAFCFVAVLRIELVAELDSFADASGNAWPDREAHVDGVAHLMDDVLKTAVAAGAEDGFWFGIERVHPSELPQIEEVGVHFRKLHPLFHSGSRSCAISSSLRFDGMMPSFL